MNDSLRESKVEWMIEKFKDNLDCPYEVVRFDGNILLNVGINELWRLVCGSGGIQFKEDNAVLGVGDGTSPAAASQTGLQANTNKAYSLVEAGYPIFGSNQQATWRATFNSTEANFHWQEFVVANGTEPTSVTLNRKVSDQGTKVAGTTWRLSITITLA
jgi:hypothetical protein